MSTKGYITIKKEQKESNNYNKSDIKIHFLRNQLMKKHTTENLSLVDFLAEDDYIGLFALSAGFGLEQAKKEFIKNNDDYNAILMSLLADSLAEAFSEEIHERVRKEWWGCGETGIRPAFGYPCCPDHQDKRAVFEFLDVEKRCGMTLTESAMIQPVSSVCGMYFANPAARYFSCGKIGEDQLADWAAQKNISVEEARKRVQH